MIRPEQQYREFLEEGRFMIQRSRETGRHVFYPRVIEPVTGSTDLEWVEASGEGTVYSATVTRKRTAEESYNVVLVDLAEGPRMMSRVDGIPFDGVRIGMKVRAKVIRENGQPMVVFVPAGADAGSENANG